MGLRPDARLLSRPTRDGPEGEPIRSRPSPRCLSFRGAGLRPCHLRQPSFTDKSFAPVLLRKPQLPVLGLIGAPQLAAILVLGQRGLEELYSARNTRALLVAGSREVGSAYYPVVAATHLAWIASLFFLIPPDALILWPLIASYVALQILRYWIIANLGGPCQSADAAAATEPEDRQPLHRSW